MPYIALKHLHITFVALSFISFFVRGIWMLTGSSLLKTKLVRIVPHVIDTVLLLSAIGLVMQIAPFPGLHAWLGTKVLGLLTYIGLGLVAFRFGKTRQVRGVFWVLAMLVFGFVVSVAITHNPAGIFA